MRGQALFLLPLALLLSTVLDAVLGKNYSINGTRVHNRTNANWTDPIVITSVAPTTTNPTTPAPSIVDDSLYTCKMLPKLCQNPDEDDKGDACRLLFPDCYGPVAPPHHVEPIDSQQWRACDVKAIENNLDRFESTGKCMIAAGMSVFSILYEQPLMRIQVHAFNRTQACREFFTNYTAIMRAYTPCRIDSIFYDRDDFSNEAHASLQFVAQVNAWMERVHIGYQSSSSMAANNAAFRQFRNSTLLHIALDPELSVTPVVCYLIGCAALCVILEMFIQLIEKHLLSQAKFVQIFHISCRDLMIGGLLQFLLLQFENWQLVTPGNVDDSRLKIAGDIIMYFLCSGILQALLLFHRLDRRMQPVHTMAVRSSSEFLHVATVSGTVTDDSHVPRILRKGVKFHIVRRFFLQLHNLPRRFSYSQYLQIVQDNLVLEMLHLDIATFVCLVCTYTIYFMGADAIFLASEFPHATHEMSREVKMLSADVYRPLALQYRLLALIVLVVLLWAGSVALYLYMDHWQRKIVDHASDCINNMNIKTLLDTLREISLRENDEATEHPDDAAQRMEGLAHKLADNEHEATSSTWWRQTVAKLSMNPPRQSTLSNRTVRPKLSRGFLRGLAKFGLALNALFFALLFSASVVIVVPKTPWWYRGYVWGLMIVLGLHVAVVSTRVVEKLAFVTGTVYASDSEMRQALETFANQLRRENSGSALATVATSV
ncbi:hypothetical protein LEN26_011194 [Aphanomyces euteiches]|nr:hypothetical protein LEN26_011194 [Aphanomyces euteiches]KAH9126303.1 hypothetical protein AeMF1_003256 [Aphanomyces euteiches]KAH9193423.1 hypothetical protein AeNC1_004597 [Aphanomyces euteiches]